MLRKTFIYLTLITSLAVNFSLSSFAEENAVQESAKEIIEDTSEGVSNVSEESIKPEVTALSAVMIDAKTGAVLYDKDCHNRLFPASMTKVMTAMLAIENSKPDEVVKHSHNAVYNIGEGSSHIGMRENEEITMDQALYGIMLASANEVCMAVAEHIDGTVEKFVERMNNKASEIGANDTHFANPHGFHDDNHYTTCYDMALIMKEAIKSEEFIKYISTYSFQIPPTNIVNETRYLHNRNKLIQEGSPFYYEYCVGSKTGYTDEAGNTLVTYGSKDGMDIITVVMKDDGTKVYDDTKALLEYGFGLYEQKTIISENEYSRQVPVVQNYEYKGEQKTRELGTVEISAKADLSVLLPKSLDADNIDFQVLCPDTVEAPVKSGDAVATVSAGYNKNTIGTMELTARGDITAFTEDELMKLERNEEIARTAVKILKMVGIAVGAIIVVLIVIMLIPKKGKKSKYRFIK